MDLSAAAALGMKTAFIARPLERGTGKPEPTLGMRFDWTANSLLELADQIGDGD
jgi:2-haloacid dehalogenase